jgi:hypothetical protein
LSDMICLSTRYVNDMDIPASQAYVGLALPGEAGSWQRECKVKIIQKIHISCSITYTAQ